jgi:hypothetical protein
MLLSLRDLKVSLQELAQNIYSFRIPAFCPVIFSGKNRGLSMSYMHTEFLGTRGDWSCIAARFGKGSCPFHK